MAIQDTTTVVYENTTKKDIVVLGIGVIKAGERVSVTAKYQPQVVLENYPGLIDVSNEPGPDTPDPAAAAPAAEVAPEVPAEEAAE